MAPSTPLTNLSAYLGDQAYRNYVAHQATINHVREGIAQNRNGVLPLSEITQDQRRLNFRLARESGQREEALERVNGLANFQDVATVRKIIRFANSVCRIVTTGPGSQISYGTGCLISPSVLITNNHVIPDQATALRTVAQFSYELGDRGRLLEPVTFTLRPDLFFMTSPFAVNPNIPFSGLDFTLVAVEPTSVTSDNLSTFGFVQLDPSLGKIIEGEYCVVIQHPKGDYKKIVLKDIRLLTLTEQFLIYESDTLPGSSGSLVLGLGTGEAVALHHSAVPRKDANGNWLRRDGTPLQPTDSEDQVEWLGNEGVRVSCIVNAFNNIAIPETMQPLYRQISEAQTPPLLVPTSLSTTAPVPKPLIAVPQTLMTTPIPAPRTESVQSVATPLATTPTIQYFDVTLTDKPTLLADWEARATAHPPQLVPGLEIVSNTPLLPTGFTDPTHRMRYVGIKTNEHPWKVAAQLEELSHVDLCRPDLETLTDIGLTDINSTSLPLSDRRLTESAIVNDGTAKVNENEFLTNWKIANWVKAATASTTLPAQQQRWWNWFAVNWPTGIKADPLRNLPAPEQAIILNNLKQMKLVQFDTGYSDHSKVAGGYNLELDHDLIDNDPDAHDEGAKFLLKFPDHGTRTASLVIGGTFSSDPRQLDGNGGLLVRQGKPLTKLIPYRVAQSVILIGRGKQVVEAANMAIRTGADVLYMCMGTYPRPMLAAIAREVYERGVIWVCAAGNDVGLVVAPALYPGTIAVAATNPNDAPWSGSSKGATVDIAAPGEDVYVPFVDKSQQEIMVYGSGTSYATPHVAAAAMLWKARYRETLRNYLPWQVVETFRDALKRSARIPTNWSKEHYGEGILDISKLLDTPPLPVDSDKLIHAYQNPRVGAATDLGIAEAAHFVWNVLKRKVQPNANESLMATEYPLTQRGQRAMEAFRRTDIPAIARAESGTQLMDTDALLHEYFNQ